MKKIREAGISITTVKKACGKRFKVRVLCLGILLAAFAFATGHTDSLTGRVVRVIDGDTVVVLDGNNEQHRIRLQGIDAPERGQPYGRASGKHLSGEAAGKQVVVEYEKRDRYGRIVGKILLGGRDINLGQVASGMAWHYKKYQGEQSPEDRKRYAETEEIARESGAGLWVEPEPVPPWEWRRRK